MPEILEVHAELVRAACEGQAAYDGIAGFDFPGHFAVTDFLFGSAGVIGFSCSRVGGHSGCVICQAFEDGAGFFATGTSSVKAELGTYGHNGLFANYVPQGEFADDSGYVFFFHGSTSDFFAQLLRGFGVLANEHDAAC